MFDAILRDLKTECLSLALAGKYADTGALAGLLPELEEAGRSSPVFFELAGLARGAVGGMADSLIALNRLASSLLASGADFDRAGGLTALTVQRASRGLRQLSFRRLSEARLTLESGGVAADDLLERLMADSELFDLRLIPSIINLSKSGRANTSRAANRLLARLRSPDALESVSERAEKAARAFLAAGDIENLAEALWELAGASPLPRSALGLMLELLRRLPEYKNPSLELAVVSAVAGQKSREALDSLEGALENIAATRAVFSLALDIYAPEDFYLRYSEELGKYRERHYPEFRDAMICHVTRGGRADNRWSDYFAEKNDRLPALLTVGPGRAPAISYLRSFKPSGGVPAPSDLLLNLALVPQVLLRMDICDFWEELWEYLKTSISACAETRGLANEFFNDQVLFTLSLGGEWIIGRLAELDENGDYPGLSRLIDKICERSRRHVSR